MNDVCTVHARWWCSVKFRAWVQEATCNCIRNISGVFLAADLPRGYNPEWHLASWVIHSPLTLPETQCCWSKHRPAIRDARAGYTDCAHNMKIHDSAHHLPNAFTVTSTQLDASIDNPQIKGRARRGHTRQYTFFSLIWLYDR